MLICIKFAALPIISGDINRFLNSVITDYKATKYELLENYRSGRNIVELANKFVTTISNRLKETPIKAACLSV